MSSPFATPSPTSRWWEASSAGSGAGSTRLRSRRCSGPGVEDYALLAYHAEGAERYDDMVEMSRRGASHYLRTGSTQEALRLAERGLAEAGEDIELLELASMAAWRADRLDDAAAYAGQWEAVTTGSPEARSRALRLRARIEFDAGRPLGQLQYLEAARQVGGAPRRDRGARLGL